MKKLTMFLVAAVVAATVAIGALSAAPSASAQRPSPDECRLYKDLYSLAMRQGARAVAAGDWVVAHFYFQNAVDDARMIGYTC
jgi:hypothetical protein